MQIYLCYDIYDIWAVLASKLLIFHQMPEFKLNIFEFAELLFLLNFMYKNENFQTQKTQTRVFYGRNDWVGLT